MMKINITEACHVDYGMFGYQPHVATPNVRRATCILAGVWLKIKALFNIASTFSKTASEAAFLVKLNVFSKSFGETWVCGRSWMKLLFPASYPQCKPEIFH
jgi:hypothetical protein